MALTVWSAIVFQGTLPCWRVLDGTGPWYKASLTYMAGLTHVSGNKELTDGLRRAIDELDKQPMGDELKEKMARARADPELMAILNDPVIQQQFSECSSTPGALVAHLKNAGVAAAKVQELIDSGMLETA